MKFLLASFAPKATIPVWGTSNYILHIPKIGTYKRTTQTPTVGGEIVAPQLKVDNIKRNIGKSLASKLRRHNIKGKGIAVI